MAVINMADILKLVKSINMSKNCRIIYLSEFIFQKPKDL